MGIEKSLSEYKLEYKDKIYNLSSIHLYTFLNSHPLVLSATSTGGTGSSTGNIYNKEFLEQHGYLQFVKGSSDFEFGFGSISLDQACKNAKCNVGYFRKSCKCSVIHWKILCIPILR